MNAVSKLFRGAGGKGGSAQVRTPFEAKNTLQSRAYARFVDLLSEGPIEGFCNADGLTLMDARLNPDCQPDVTSDYKLWYDPMRFDIEFDSGTSGPYFVYAKVADDNPLANEPLFSDSVGYPFSGDNLTGLDVSISATFREPKATSNQTSFPKESAQVALQVYPKDDIDQVRTRKTITQGSHGFAVGNIIQRIRISPNVYEWRKLPDGENVFSFQTRIVAEVLTTDRFAADVHPIRIEGRVRGLYVIKPGSNYLSMPGLVNPITQAAHGFYVGQTIELVDNVWVPATSYTQEMATVINKIDDNTFEAYQQTQSGPQLNIPSAIATAIYFDDTPLANAATLRYNFANVKLDYRLGEEIQTPLIGFEQTETLLDGSQSVAIAHSAFVPGGAAVIKELPPGDWDELVINLLLPQGLYRQDVRNGDVFGLGDNYGDTGAPSSVQSLPVNQPPIIRITYKIIQPKEGGEYPSAEYPFGPNDGYVVIKGKTMSPYELSVRGSLLTLGSTAKGDHHYRLYFYRMTPDDEDYVHGDTARRSVVVVNSITGLINARMTYPFCAVVGMELDAEQFSHIPTRGYQVKLLKIALPSNYFPPFSRRERFIRGVMYVDYRLVPEYNRLPSGDGVYDDAGASVEQMWDGTFYLGWTSNPAWICYAMCTDTRVGFGKNMALSNKWLFYKIARYCDQLIPVNWDGVKYIDTEPRFACSAYFQTFEEAWRVLSDIASSFSGYLFYQSGTVIPVQDCPRPVRFSFGPANVENGFFTYSGINKQGRYSSVVARFNDPANFFKQTPAIEQDESLIGQLGWKPLERTAFGCTSRYQAQRFARKLLISSRELTTTVKFTTGLLGSVLRPGDVIEVYDPVRSSVPFAGRILSIRVATETSLTSVTLDRLITSEELAITDEALFATYGLVCQRPLGVPQANEIIDEATLLKYMDSQVTPPLRIAGFSLSPEGTTVVMLIENLPAGVEVGYVWGLRRHDVQPQTFQVITVEESTKHKFGIVALEYQPALYDAVDYDAAYDEPSINPDLDAWKRPYPPRNLLISSWPFVNDSGERNYRIMISWSPPEKGFAREYIVEWRRGLGNYQVLTRTPLTHAETIVTAADSYCTRIRTVGLTGVVSTPIEECLLIGVLDATNKEIVSGLEITGQGNDMIFLTNDVSFDWRVNWSGATSEFHTEVPPVLPPSVSDYEVTIYNPGMTLVYATSRTTSDYALLLDRNRSLTGGPYRDFIFGVRVRTGGGGLSLETRIRVFNEKPPIPEFEYDSDDAGNLVIKFRWEPSLHPKPIDFDHYNVWVSEQSGFGVTPNNLAYSGSSNTATITIRVGVPTYFRIAALDGLAQSEMDCQISNQYSVVGTRIGALTVWDFLNQPWGT